ncbi:MAG: type IV toxin-antitoxin system AbiEi family antitoxin domain-containing protein [Actinomycetota bacterium]
MHDIRANKPPRPDHERLFEVASEQGGYFTADQARACGFSRASLSYHARRGRFLRVKRGLYRLAQYPASPREDVIAAWLGAGRDEAVVSHESALDILGLSDVVPERVHLTVPRSRRYRSTSPGVAIHTTTRPPDSGEVVTRDGIPVTSPARSIVDAAEAGTAPEQVVRAAHQAIEQGLTSPAPLGAATRGHSSRVDRLIQRALNDVATS